MGMIHRGLTVILAFALTVLVASYIANERTREPDSLVALCKSFARWKSITHNDVPALTQRCNQ